MWSGRMSNDAFHGHVSALDVLPFRRTFRMPFAVDRHGRAKKSDRKSAAFCLAGKLTDRSVFWTGMSVWRRPARSDLRRAPALN
jgi:hypothetical protein